LHNTPILTPHYCTYTLHTYTYTYTYTPILTYLYYLYLHYTYNLYFIPYTPILTLGQCGEWGRLHLSAQICWAGFQHTEGWGQYRCRYTNTLLLHHYTTTVLHLYLHTPISIPIPIPNTPILTLHLYLTLISCTYTVHTYTSIHYYT
jgi:hypothetical protein